ncbi:MAG: hypothetical protein KIS78_21300 [Labilithrix sp.]|nr:hypothetical protein [Labilithrix sp.]
MSAVGSRGASCFEYVIQIAATIAFVAAGLKAGVALKPKVVRATTQLEAPSTPASGASGAMTNLPPPPRPPADPRVR